MKQKKIKTFDKIFNPNNIWLLAREIDGLDAEGSYILAAIRSLKFITSFDYYYGFATSVEETIQACKIYGLLTNDIGYAFTIQIDFQCFRSIYNTKKDGVVPMPTVNDISLGRHSVVIEGYEDETDMFYFPNSWGETWGNNGWGAIKRDYIERYGKEVIIISRAKYGFTQDKLIANEDYNSSSKKFIDVWKEENKSTRTSIKWNSEKLFIVAYDWINTSGDFIQIFDLYDSFNQKLGWTHIQIPYQSSAVQDDTGFVIELFVWPDFRRAKYGKLLEKTCSDYLKQNGYKKIIMPLYEMDDLLGKKSPARLFLKKMGFQITEEIKSYPMKTGFASKNI